jgi:hypothetical protein
MICQVAVTQSSIRTRISRPKMLSFRHFRETKIHFAVILIADNWKHSFMITTKNSHGHESTWNNFKSVERRESWNIYHQEWRVRAEIINNETKIIENILRAIFSSHQIWDSHITDCFETDWISLMKMIVSHEPMWWVWKPKRVPMRNLWNIFIFRFVSVTCCWDFQSEKRTRVRRNDHPCTWWSS